MKTKLLAEMIFGMVIHGIGTKTQIIERIASEIDAHHEPVSGTYHEPVSGTYKLTASAADDVEMIRAALVLLEMIDMADDGDQARDALKALDRIAGKLC